MAAQVPLGTGTSPSRWPTTAGAVVLLTAAITWLALGGVLCLAGGLRTRHTDGVAGTAAEPVAHGTA